MRRVSLHEHDHAVIVEIEGDLDIVAGHDLRHVFSLAPPLHRRASLLRPVARQRGRRSRDRSPELVLRAGDRRASGLKGSDVQPAPHR